MSISYNFFHHTLSIVLTNILTSKQKGNRSPHDHSWIRSITRNLPPGPLNTPCIVQYNCYENVLIDVVYVCFVAFVHQMHYQHVFA